MNKLFWFLLFFFFGFCWVLHANVIDFIVRMYRRWLVTFTISSVFSHKLGNVALRLRTLLVMYIETMIITREVNSQGSTACQKACFTMTIHTVGKWPTIFIFYKKWASFFVLANGWNRKQITCDYTVPRCRWFKTKWVLIRLNSLIYFVPTCKSVK